MNSSKLPPVLNVAGLNSNQEIVDFFYDIFLHEFVGPQNRKILNGTNIFFDFNSKVDNKFESFWHLISLDLQEKFRVLPCNNDPISLKCVRQNCNNQKEQIVLSIGTRNICYYRGVRIHWVGEIIRLAEKNDPNIKIWEFNNKLHIRFQHDTADYALIFAITKKSLVFISGFPVFYVNKKQIYESQYCAYQTLLQSAVSNIQKIKPVIAMRKPESPSTTR